MIGQLKKHVKNYNSQRGLTFQPERAMALNCSLQWTNIISLGNTWIKTMTSYFNELYQETVVFSALKNTTVILWYASQGCTFGREKSLHRCRLWLHFHRQCWELDISSENWHQLLQNRLLEVMCLPSKKGLWESRLDKRHVLHEFFGYQVGNRVSGRLSKNWIETVFLFKKWHILMKKQIIINEVISCVTSASYTGIAQTRFLYQ